MTKATGPLFAVHFKRRRKGRTNYAARLALLKSSATRLVVRKSNSSVSAQLVNFNSVGDATVAQANSRDLKQFGFEGKCNTPSAYLVGYLAGKRALQKGVAQFVLDIGLHSATKGNVLFAIAKGAIDAGLTSRVGEDKLPSQKRIEGKHLAPEVSAAFTSALEKIKSHNPVNVAAKSANKTANKSANKVVSSVKSSIQSAVKPNASSI